MNFPWQKLPACLAVPLLKGSVGRDHLIAMAETAINMAAQPAQTSPATQGDSPPKPDQAFWGSLGLDMMRASFEYDFYDGSHAGQMLKLHGMRPFLPRPLVGMAQLISKASRPPQDMEDLNRHLAARDFEESSRYLKRMQRREPNNLFWTRPALLIGFTAGKTEWMLDWLNSFGGIPKPALEASAGDILFSAGEYAKAKEKYESALGFLPVLLWRERLAETRFRLGLAEEALKDWQAVAEERPWHTNAVLRHGDALRGLDQAGPLPEGRGAALLYTWNKAEPLNMTLEHLAASELGDASLIVLDNGSTDDTPAIIRKYQDIFGRRFSSLTMPCNIGAPAARNWLLTLPETRACDWVAFLDDDAFVPADWLGLLGKAMKAFPDHPVYGCRVVDHATPMFIQSADLHIERGGECGSPHGGQNGLEPGHVRNFSVSGLHHHVLDFGQFSYARPCLSVTGCCHLFRRKALDEIGHFDLRFSPSQYDDLEHDLRHALKNGLPFYQGHLRVRHMKRSGQAAWKNHSRLMSAWANLFKLQTKYQPEDYDLLRTKEHEALLKDMLERLG